MKKSILLASLLAAVALSACSKKAEEPAAAPAPVAASEPAPMASEPASAASAADAGASAADAGASAASK
ncbi:MAG: hypothetical protein E6Q67_02215 [Roseateles sp.]|nr:MAG: hypothetical protein E6Q67_02215 [Roseateles sp.]